MFTERASKKQATIWHGKKAKGIRNSGSGHEEKSERLVFDQLIVYWANHASPLYSSKCERRFILYIIITIWTRSIDISQL